MLVNPFKMLLLKRLADVRGMTCPVEGAPPVYIDNRALDRFIDRFREVGCRDTNCDVCQWCHRFAAKAIRMDPQRRAAVLAAYQDVFEAMDGGGLWRYLPCRSSKPGRQSSGGCSNGRSRNSVGSAADRCAA
ncbi:MAG: hypothetical protein A2W31_11940 [Planctomycetes bacterium RBG_16_64_10]|nr:MAG: hypothetical protein A2W31_11940 [Planctomycetes bacterium RBG_16_64_10]